MRAANLASQNVRQAETGLVWEEKLTGAMGTLEINRFATFRVRATGATTVTIDGVLAMTMSAGEIALFNAGQGDPSPTGMLVPTVPVVIAGAAAFVQVARDQERKQ